jgi:hypothetical protein
MRFAVLGVSSDLCKLIQVSRPGIGLHLKQRTVATPKLARPKVARRGLRRNA